MTKDGQWKKMKISNYTVPELEHIKELANFTKDEMDYFNLKSEDMTNDIIALTLCISDAKVSVLARKVKDKIRRIESYDKANDNSSEGESYDDSSG